MPFGRGRIRRGIKAIHFVVVDVFMYVPGRGPVGGWGGWVVGAWFGVA